MVTPFLVPVLIRPLKRELLCLALVLIVLWLAAGVCSLGNRYSAFYRPDPGKLLREHDMYRDTAMKAWKDLQSYAQSKGIQGMLFDKGNDICVGILSIIRTRAMERKYLTTLVMSLVTRVNWSKHKDRLSIKIFNMQGNPSEHTEAMELGRLFRVESPKHDEGIQLPPESNHFERTKAKENADFLAALRALQHCKYAIILEDDALASFNWLDSTLAHVESVKAKNWLYLKLYAPFTWMGWGLEAGHIVTLLSLGVAAGLCLSLLVGTCLYGKSANARTEYELLGSTQAGRKYGSFVSPRFCSPTSTLIAVCSLTVLFHCLGRQHLFPYTRGVHKHDLNASMVATLYPQSQIKPLADHYSQMLILEGVKSRPKYIAKDQVPTDYRTKNNLDELIAVPSVFQHCGIHSSLEFKAVHNSTTLSVATSFEDDGKPIVFVPPTVQ